MKQKQKAFVPTAAVLTAIALVLVISPAQPLLRSDAYVVTASLDGRPIPAELRHPPFLRGIYYVHLTADHPLRFGWFGVAFPRRAVFLGPTYIGWRGIPYIHTDQASGVSLTNGKIEDHWSVAFTSRGVQFSNASLSISLTEP